MPTVGMDGVLSLHVFIRAAGAPRAASAEILFVKKLALFCIPRKGGHTEKLYPSALAAAHARLTHTAGKF